MKKQNDNIITAQSKIDWSAETQRIIKWVREADAKIVYIDLFCGFGGTTSGVDKAAFNNKKIALVILGINHDRVALACHKAHNPNTLHLKEDVRKVKLQPIADLCAELRRFFPWLKIFLWCSAECTHLSKAKGGDSRDPDSRSLAEELYRYQEAILPDVIQVENVTEWRSWGPLEHKRLLRKDVKLKEWKYKIKVRALGLLRSRNEKVWMDNNLYVYKKDKRKGFVPWMVPIKSRKAEFFNIWVEQLKSYGYAYEDKDINAADQGAYTARVRYYGQFAKGMPILWPQQTHAKDPEKLFQKSGAKLEKHKPVRDVLDFVDTGDSLFTPGRIKSNQTFKRVHEGAIKFIAGGKKKYSADREIYEEWLNSGQTAEKGNPVDAKDFLFKYNSASKDLKCEHSVIDVHGPAPTVPCRNMIAKAHFEYINKQVLDHPELTAKVLPFIVQYNNNCHFNSVDEPSKVLTKKDKFSLAFIHQRNGGNPSARVISTDGAARTITSTGGNQELVQVEKVLPYISNYHGNGHNCHSVDDACPAACAADIHALIQHQPFIFRQFSNGGQHQSIDRPAGALLHYPKMNIISPAWIMDTSYGNIGKSVDESAKSLLASRRHSYIVNPSYYGHSSSVDKPSPVVVARQDKAPLHLAQIEYGNETFYGVVIYSTDSTEVKELKYFMAIYGIVDIKMRMLKIIELLPIQGFPADYIEKVRAMGIKVSDTDAKKYIGNSQEVTTAKALAEPYGQYVDGDKEKFLKVA